MYNRNKPSARLNNVVGFPVTSQDKLFAQYVRWLRVCGQYEVYFVFVLSSFNKNKSEVWWRRKF
jgi:hypothetical protein